MSSKNNVLGILGIVLAALGLLVWVIRMELVAYAAAPLALGGVLILIYAAMNINFLMEKLTGRAAMEGANMAVSIAVFLAIVIFLEMLFANHSARFDMTEAKKFSLADQTINMVKGLKEPIHALFLINPQTPRQTEQAKDLLALYAFYSNQFTYELLDPEKNPEKVEKLAPVTLGAIYVSAKEERREKVDPVNENTLTNALMKLIKTSQKVIYFTTGHTERSISSEEEEGISGIKQLIEEEGYKVQELQLFNTGEVPNDAAMVVIVRPKTPFFEPEITALQNYLSYGGKLIALIDPETNSGLEKFLDENYGVVLGNDWIVENNKMLQLFGGSPIAPLIAELGDHEITRAFGNSVPGIVFPIVRSVTPKSPLPEGVNVTELVKTSKMSWAETNIKKLMDEKQALLDEGEDKAGPVAIAVAVTMPAKVKIAEVTEEKKTDAENPEEKKEEPETRLIVFGDSDFINNQQYMRGLDLLMNSLNWLSKQEDMISIRPKDDKGEAIIVTPVQANLVFYTSLVALPSCVAIFGFVICLMKRFRG
ncbi:MAG: Gldg family protein [Candidatus Omnitrophota bacterium]